MISRRIAEKGVGVAVVEGQGSRARAAPAHGVGTPDGDGQPLLLLRVGPRLGTGLLEDQRVRPVSGVAVAQTATSGPNSVLTGPVSATPRWTTGSKHLCDAQAADAQPVPDVATFAQVTQPSTDADGLHAPGLRFGDPRVMAPLAAVVRFTHLVAGFSNRQLVALVATLLDAPYSSRQAT